MYICAMPEASTNAFPGSEKHVRAKSRTGSGEEVDKPQKTPRKQKNTNTKKYEKKTKL